MDPSTKKLARFWLKYKVNNRSRPLTVEADKVLSKEIALHSLSGLDLNPLKNLDVMRLLLTVNLTLNLNFQDQVIKSLNLNLVVDQEVALAKKVE